MQIELTINGRPYQSEIAAGETLLSHFVRGSKTVDFLVSKGADPKLQNPSDNTTPLMKLVSSGSEVDPDIVETLVRAGADVGATTRKEERTVDALDIAKQTLADTLRAAKETTNELHRLAWRFLMYIV